MAFSRSIICIVKNQHIRYSSDKAGSNFWEIRPKRWRSPSFPEPKSDAITQKLAPSPGTIKFFNKLNPFEIEKLSGLRKRNLFDEQKGLQDNVDDETQQRGHAVSLAQFLVFTGARVRFSSTPEWISKEDNYEKMPSISEIGNQLVAINMSFLDIDFVTVKTIQVINSVTFLSVQGCPNFDDYCLDHVSATLPGLEELDLSNCPLITSRGLGILYRLKRLRLLRLNGVQSDPELELLCVLLEEHFPNLKIEGVTYLADKR